MAWGVGGYGVGLYGGHPETVGYAPKHAGLSVVMESSLGSYVLTRQVSGLTIKDVTPGGYAAVEFDLPRRLNQSRLPLDAQVRVYDTATGEQVGGGRVIEQGLSSDGLWRVSCLGEGIAALQDLDEPYMVIDTNPEASSSEQWVGVKTKKVSAPKRKLTKKERKRRKKGWSQAVDKTKIKLVTDVVAATAQSGPAPNGTSDEGLLFQIPQGTQGPLNASVIARFYGPYLCGMRLGAYSYRYICGQTSGNWTVRADSLTVGGSAETDRNDNWNSGLISPPWIVHTTDFNAARDAIEISLRRGPAIFTADNTVWQHIRDLRIRSQLMDETGTVRPGAWHAAVSVTAGPVFIDLIARRCPSLKVGTVEAGTTAFTHLTWYDGATAKEIIDELLDEDGTLVYHAREVDSDGKTPIHLTKLPTTVRYELTPDYGYSGPTPLTEIITRVVVTGVDGLGNAKYNVYDQTPSGQVARSIHEDLGNQWNQTRSDAIGAAILENHASPPNSGTLTVAKDALDLITGRWVKPWAIRSGELCRVRGVQPLPDTLNPDAKQDGVTIFRISSASYSTDTGTATLELDTPVFDQDRAIADILS